MAVDIMFSKSRFSKTRENLCSYFALGLFLASFFDAQLELDLPFDIYNRAREDSSAHNNHDNYSSSSVLQSPSLVNMAPMTRSNALVSLSDGLTLPPQVELPVCLLWYSWLTYSLSSRDFGKSVGSL